MVMRTNTMPITPRHGRSEAGYSILEVLIAITILTIVSGTVMNGVLNLTKVNGSVNNRTEMHAGVRNATELLQQEIGQAGRITLPNYTYKMTTTWAADPDAEVLTPVTLTVTDAAGANVIGLPGIFLGEKLILDNGVYEETIEVVGMDISTKRISSYFTKPHPVTGARVSVNGGFQAGVVPESVANGSDGFHLKLFGDVNGNSNMVYVEYFCDVNGGNLYRRSIPFEATALPTLTADLSLLNHLKPNPNNDPCFTYQTVLASATGRTSDNLPYVTDVAVTMTVETPAPDPITGLIQQQTKALLNVSPRNVFNVWQLANAGMADRVQPTPASINTLLPQH